MKKRSGLMGALDKAGFTKPDGALEPDGSDAPPLPSSMPSLPPAAPAPAFSYPSATPSYAPAPPTTLDAEDQARLQQLEAQVYASPSAYVTFRDVRASLSNTSDLQTVFKVLTASHTGVTAAKILVDVDAHLGIVAQKRAEFEAQIQAARASRIDEPTKQIADLTAANNTAAQEIADRMTKIAQLQKGAQDADRSITDGTARFKLVEDQLNAPLLQIKQLLATAR